MAELNTGSIITDVATGRNKTFTSVSTNIIIKVGAEAVGAVKSLSIDESRTVAMIDEVGTDGHIDSVPSKSTDISGSCSRTRFNNLRIAPAFSRGYLHVHSQRIPFDIDIIDTFAGVDGGTWITTTIKNVWITKISTNIQADNFVLVDDMSFVAEAIYSTLGANSNAVPSAAGGRNMGVFNINDFERAADIGRRRGALDGFGLLSAISTV